MQVGRGGMGSHKHGVSGTPGKSPKLRMAQRLAAERDERKAKPKPMARSLAELFAKGKRHD
jgi:hypothetical protein